MPKFKCQFTTFEVAKQEFTKKMNEVMLVQLRQAARAFAAAASRAVPVRTGFARGTFKNISEAVGGQEAGSSTSADILKTGRPINLLKRRLQKSPLIKRLLERNEKEKIQEINKRFNEIVKRSTKTPTQTVLEMFQALKKGIRSRKIEGLGTSTEHLKEGRKRGKAGAPIEFYRGSGGKILKTPSSGRQFATPASQIIQESAYIYTFNFEVWIDYFNINEAFSNPYTPSAPWNAFKVGQEAFLNYMRTTAFKRLPKINDFLIETQTSVDGTRISNQTLHVSRPQ